MPQWGLAVLAATVLTLIEEAMIVEFRRRTLLPLDDVMGCLKDSIPNLTRSSLHRCLERHGISWLPDSQEKASKRGKFAETTIGYVHLDHCELRLADGKLHMFLAIDRVSKFTYAEFHDRTKMLNGAAFLQSVIEAFPYRIHTVLTDNGMPLPTSQRTGAGSLVSGGSLSTPTGQRAGTAARDGRAGSTCTMVFSRARCRTIWVRRVTCRRKLSVASSGIQTSGRN